MMTESETPKNSFAKRLGVAFLAVATGLLAITSQSFWMDEGSTMFRAMMPDLASWWRISMHLGGSDVQMPIYMWMVWAWEKAGASSEYVLRLVNLPWVVVGALALARVRWWPLVFLTSPFVWYYASELRPYAMQIAAGAVAAWALFRVAESDADEKPWKGLHAAAGAAFLLGAASLSAGLWASGLWLGVLVLRPDWLLKPGFWLRLLPWAVPIGALTVYYIYTVMEGYRATASGGGGLLSMIYGFYELIGMTGLGPGRNELRIEPIVLLKWLPLIAPAALLVVAVWLRGVLAWTTRSTRRQQLAVMMAVMIPIFALAAVGVFMDFRVLGRHLSPLLPAVLLPLAVALERTRTGNLFWPATAVATVMILFASAVSVRVSERHAREDYRTAANLALDAMADGKTVLWMANMNCARYYAYLRGGSEWVNRIQPWESDRSSTLFVVDLVVINRPDIHVRDEGYEKELRANYFEPAEEVSGFAIWRPR